ncbi:TPA: MFS transporter, partial [Citrobacter koseri]|nr:MFS transporter [Citrobacter koseri]
IGTVILSPLSGYLYERLGFSHTYFMMGCTVLFFTIISAFLLQNNKRTEPVIAENAHA